MGQKIHPYGLRLGIIKTWQSRWYSKDNYKEYLLEDEHIRRFVRKLLEPELPEVRVISFAELLPEVAVKPLGRATVANL